MQQKETSRYNIFCYTLTLFYNCGTYFSPCTCIYKTATSIWIFYHKDLISWKSLKKKNFFKKKMQRFICKKNAHGFEPIKLLCIYIYVPTILYWLDLPQKNSSSWQNLVENLHQDKLKHLNCWQFIHNFSKPFFFFLSRVMQWCCNL